jgi:hypothetical protein
VGVEDGLGEGVEIADGVEVALVGDASSIVLEAREGAFGQGAGFVGLLKVGGGAIQLEAMVVVEVDDAGASVGFAVCVWTDLGVWFVGTDPLLSAIAFLFIEPTSPGFHFQSSGTEELAVLGVGVLERLVSSGVEGDVGLSFLRGDVPVYIPSVEGSIGQEDGSFESLGFEFVQEGAKEGDISRVGGFCRFGEDDQTEAGGRGEDGGFESPEESGKRLSLGIFIRGGFRSESGIGIAGGEDLLVPSFFDKVLGVVLLDMRPDFFDVTGDGAIEEVCLFDVLDGLSQERLEEGVVHPLDLFSEVAIGGDDLLPGLGRARLVGTVFFGTKAYGEDQGRMVQEELSKAGEGLDLLIHHHDVGFEVGFQGDPRGGEGGEEGEVEDVPEPLVALDEGIVVQEVLEGRACSAGGGMGAARYWSHPQEDDFQSVEQHDDHEERLQDPAPQGEYPDGVLEGSGGGPPTGCLRAGSVLKREVHKQHPVLGSPRRGNIGSYQDPHNDQPS